jgi:TonB family protein
VTDARLPAALGASLLLHGAALALVGQMPHGWQLSLSDLGRWGGGALQASLRLTRSDDALESSPGTSAARPTSVPAPHSRGAAAAPSGGVVAPSYLPAEELDERPLVRTAVHPAFPPEAGVASGRVVLRLLINEAGAVDRLFVLRADPAGVFEAAAMEAFAKAKFTPGRKDGSAVKSALTVELRFGEAPPALAQARQQELPLFQPPRRALFPRHSQTQEKP